MIYDVTAIRNAVRSILRNQTQQVYPNDQLDQAIRMGLRRLSQDSPREIVTAIPGTNTTYYKLSDTVAGWVSGQSVIRSATYPAPIIASEDPYGLLRRDAYSVAALADGDYLILAEQWATGDSGLIRFTGAWELAGLDDAETTTIPSRLYNAMEAIAIYYACLALASESAGFMSEQVPGDLIDWRSKSQEYRDMAEQWLTTYNTEVNPAGAAGANEKAIMIRAQYPSRRWYITH